ncbi:hypothetical protein [bacterium endosymbiont of Pedicinus badii]|uniref:hypothetical protein n=1 Tax=bacterium endosymbiont of Pedicinus badii TaxID=1719126 RepID=UPI0009BAAB48|nr:hypothetical protein [bacterium endosymbiont of Pedicinus badii]OQM34476.1 hypothetical protein AOQ89_01140 [bacterium endosymbiont of Pedicinus badii]
MKTKKKFKFLFFPILLFFFSCQNNSIMQNKYRNSKKIKFPKNSIFLENKKYETSEKILEKSLKKGEKVDLSPPYPPFLE